MNMYDFSEKNNREMGIFIERLNDKGLFEKAVAEAHSIKESSKSISLEQIPRIPAYNSVKPKLATDKIVTIKKDSGFCIRCKKQIPYNSDKPYCKECFSIWEEYSNENYVENICHNCGKEDDTTILSPECYNCYRNIAAENKKARLR